MNKLKDFMSMLLWILVLSLTLSSCGKISTLIGGKTKEGEVKVTNHSPYTADDPVNIKLVRLDYGDNITLGEKKCSRNKSITFTDVPAEVPLTIEITDKNGRKADCINADRYSYYYNDDYYSGWRFSLSLNETAKFNYNGDYIERTDWGDFY